VIRVNLLPHAAERRTSGSESSQTWLLFVMLAVVVEIVVLFFFHGTKEDELNEVQSEVGRVQTQIEAIQVRVKDHEKIKSQLAQLRAREDAIAQLQAGRKGPTAVLLELSRVLTAGKGPTVDQAKLDELREQNPNAVYNPGWDPKRVWLQIYSESERSVRLEGVARDASDVYEFAQRLKLSQYFDKVTLLPGKQRPKTARSVELVSFALQVKVNY
jgi:type IV pilus assembly protein PilN